MTLFRLLLFRCVRASCVFFVCACGCDVAASVCLLFLNVITMAHHRLGPVILLQVYASVGCYVARVFALGVWLLHHGFHLLLHIVDRFPVYYSYVYA